MKLLAMRFGEDDEDIRVLLRETGIKTVDGALSLLAQMYPRLFLEQILGADTSRES